NALNSALIRRHQLSPLFPYTTLFRSSPSLLMLSIQVIEAVLKDQRMREQAHLIQHEVTALMDDLARLDDRTRKLQSHFLSAQREDRKSTRLNSSHVKISYAVFCLKKK